MSKRTAIVALAAAATSILAAGTGTAATAGCKAGVTSVDGSPARVFCGPAKATVQTRGKTLSSRQGACDAAGGGLVVNIGTFVAGGTSKRPYFGLLVTSARPGTYARQQLSYRSGAVHDAAFVTVKLKGSRGGTFAGTALGGGRVTGSFSC